MAGLNAQPRHAYRQRGTADGLGRPMLLDQMSCASISKDELWLRLGFGEEAEVRPVCCETSDFDVITSGVYSDKTVLEAKSLLRCRGCRQTWLLTGQARPLVIAEVTTPG